MPVATPPTGFHHPADDEPLSRRVLDGLGERYDIREEAGRGGMATVWLALRRSDGKRVALKVLRRGLAQALGTHRFLREIGIASHVHSPALMPLEESGEVDGVLYYVMPFAEGGSLRALMERERQLALADAVRIARSLAMGLSALHAEGFVHRDIKPENVLLDADGSVFLADYGIARAISSAESEIHTSTGIVLGTPTYMSPEQAGGELVDARSDLYSLGCLLYEMLVGSPPFHGVSTQALIARHMGEPPASLRRVRPTISDELESVVLRTLAKVPADRFASADAFVAALDAAQREEAGVATPRRRPRSSRRIIAVALAAFIVTGGISAYWYPRRAVALDPDRVVVFPFTTVGPGHAGEGEQMAFLIGSALERTEATKWLDGLPLLNEQERIGPRALGAERARELARGARARYYLAGSVSHLGDSVTVQLRVHDAQNGSVVAGRTESAAKSSASAGDLVLKAVVSVLPSLTGLAKVVDVSALTGRNPAAVDSWLRGEREYRRYRMPEALRFLEQAVSADSFLAPAAFRAALAASWTKHPDTALALVRLALRHADVLSARQRPFARSLERFLAGRADEAIIALRPALTPEEETADAWMLAGEIQLHLLPTIGLDSSARRVIPAPTVWPLEAFAQDAFERARAIDPEFSPPFEHMAYYAARRGDATAFARYATLLTTTNPDSILAARTGLIDRCIRTGATSIDWKAESKRNVRRVFEVGTILHSATAPGVRRCAVSALSAVLAADTAVGAEDWSALVALHGMLVAQGEVSRALRLVDSATTTGLPQAVALFVIDEAAGVNVGHRGANFVAQLEAAITSRGPSSLWLLSMRAARAHDAARLVQIVSLLDARTRAPAAQRLDSLMARVALAYLAVAQHDTTLALRRFEELIPTAPHQEVESSVWESLAPERLEYARLLLARGKPADAHRVASTIDQPSIFIHQLFLRASLDLRAAAARALNDRRLERRAVDQIASLNASK